MGSSLLHYVEIWLGGYGSCVPVSHLAYNYYYIYTYYISIIYFVAFVVFFFGSCSPCSVMLCTNMIIQICVICKMHAEEAAAAPAPHLQQCFAYAIVWPPQTALCCHRTVCLVTHISICLAASLRRARSCVCVYSVHGGTIEKLQAILVDSA